MDYAAKGVFHRRLEHVYWGIPRDPSAMDFLKMLADMGDCVFQGTSYPEFFYKLKENEVKLFCSPPGIAN